MKNIYNKTVILDLTNIKSGGALQVAQSFLLDSTGFPFEHVLLLSPKLSSFVKSNNLNIKYIELNIFGNIFHFFYYNYLLFISNFSFHLFGPIYSLFVPTNSIVGFAQPHIIYPSNVNLNFFEKIRFYLKKLFFKRFKYFHVELPHVKYSLEQLGFSNVRVINNALGSFSHFNSNKVFFEKDPDFIYFGYLTRDYKHKNIDLLYEAARSGFLKKVKFVTSLTYEELSKRPIDYTDFIINVGAVEPLDLSSFYNNIDAIVFPSNLECFSASLIEAMYFKKPILCSNYVFNYDVCKDQVIYFEPNDLNGFISKVNSINKDVINYDIPKRFLSSKDRTNEYVNYINEVLNESI